MFSNIDFVAELKQDKITTQLRLITLTARKPKKWTLMLSVIQ